MDQLCTTSQVLTLLYLTAVKWLQKNEPTSEGISPEEIKARKYGYIN